MVHILHLRSFSFGFASSHGSTSWGPPVGMSLGIDKVSGWWLTRFWRFGAFGPVRHAWAMWCSGCGPRFSRCRGVLLFGLPGGFSLVCVHPVDICDRLLAEGGSLPGRFQFLTCSKQVFCPTPVFVSGCGLWGGLVLPAVLLQPWYLMCFSFPRFLVVARVLVPPVVLLTFLVVGVLFWAVWCGLFLPPALGVEVCGGFLLLLFSARFLTFVSCPALYQAFLGFLCLPGGFCRCTCLVLD